MTGIEVDARGKDVMTTPHSADTGLLPDITLRDILSGLASLRPDLGGVLRSLPALIPRPPGRQMSIGKRFVQSVEAYPDRDFLRFEGQSITYRDANAHANRIADFLSRQGISRGDVVAIESRNHPDVVITMLAIVKLGAIAGMLNFHQRGAVLEHSLGLIGAKVLIYQRSRRGARVRTGVGAARGSPRLRRVTPRRGAVFPAQSRRHRLDPAVGHRVLHLHRLFRFDGA